MLSEYSYASLSSCSSPYPSGRKRTSRILPEQNGRQKRFLSGRLPGYPVSNLCGASSSPHAPLNAPAADGEVPIWWSIAYGCGNSGKDGYGVLYRHGIGQVFVRHPRSTVKQLANHSDRAMDFRNCAYWPSSSGIFLYFRGMPFYGRSGKRSHVSKL